MEISSFTRFFELVKGSWAVQYSDRSLTEAVDTQNYVDEAENSAVVAKKKVTLLEL